MVLLFLFQRSTRIAFLLLNKLGHRGEQSLKPRDRVALVYTSNDPISFLVAFYGCLLASVVPVAIEVPTYRKVRLLFLFLVCHPFARWGCEVLDCLKKVLRTDEFVLLEDFLDLGNPWLCVVLTCTLNCIYRHASCASKLAAIY